MKKRTISLMLVGAMVATMFAGCGNSEANTNASSTEAGKTGGAEAGNVSISFYTTETGKDDMFQELIAESQLSILQQETISYSSGWLYIQVMKDQQYPLWIRLTSMRIRNE